MALPSPLVSRGGTMFVAVLVVGVVLVLLGVTPSDAGSIVAALVTVQAALQADRHHHGDAAREE